MNKINRSQELKDAVHVAIASISRIVQLAEDHPESVGELRREIAGAFTAGFKLKIMKLFL